MRTIFYTLMILLLASTAIKAQTIKAGPVMGLNYNSIYFNESFTVKDEQYQFRTNGGGFGLMAGAFAKLEYKNVFTELNFVFTQENSKALLSGDQVSRLQDINMNRIALPLKIGYVVDNKFNVFGGVQLNQMVDASFVPSNSMLYANYDKSLTPTTAGFFFGVGVEIQDFNLGLNYSGNLGGNTIQTSFQNETLSFDQQDRRVNFTLSYNLGVKNLNKREKDIYFDNKDDFMVTD